MEEVFISCRYFETVIRKMSRIDPPLVINLVSQLIPHQWGWHRKLLLRWTLQSSAKTFSNVCRWVCRLKAIRRGPPIEVRCQSVATSLNIYFRPTSLQWNPNNRKKNIPQKFAETFSLLLSALSFLNWILSVCRCESNGLDQKHVINLHQTYPSLLILRPKFW